MSKSPTTPEFKVRLCERGYENIRNMELHASILKLKEDVQLD